MDIYVVYPFWTMQYAFITRILNPALQGDEKSIKIQLSPHVDLVIMKYYTKATPIRKMV